MKEGEGKMSCQNAFSLKGQEQPPLLYAHFIHYVQITHCRQAVKVQLCLQIS
jgi:hypothetical protein